ncbi:hypothetical protein PHYSODRAFT_478682 [Phytophthora sojae]|uniref:Major facilitator superfamily (MFS) profile domain-containing protein n=1 Tax=Phytophthora sojae (strain P6497) TaxID=1094619 RepID=G4Z1L7_PHYSP|nr:hypothetical protein PHYSODRAFT_478682 [Phytophthora sojae]EGZ25928.1 hypothetical protein PHYSODRAFT_478682 [Phytophthora sojae]|eukprot:XP_009521216.1 hypothetical protein PHYSODRAFT_478682 [Phytophthora sojae]
MVNQALSVNGGGTFYGTTSANKYQESAPLLKTSQSPPQRRLSQWYTNMFMINFLEFATESSRGIVLPTLFLYTSSLGGDLAFMGFINALFSVGRLLSSTAFGWMCDRYSFRSVYLISTFICLVGNVIYLIADEHMAGSLTALAASRFIVGFGGGNRSVCRADVASITTINQRLPYLTILVAVVFLGYALTPGLGSLVANTDLLFCGVHFNKFTSPGMILVVLNVLTIFGILTVYDDSVTVNDGPEEEETEGGPTVNVPLFIAATDSDPESVSAVVDASNFQFYLGLLGLLSYLSIELFRHKIRDENWVHLGFAMVLAGNVLLAQAPESLTLTQLSLAEFLVWSVGCPISTTVVLAAFSKLLGGRPQGTLMGLLGSTACISRSVLPLLPAVVSTLEPVFWINIVLCASSIVLLWWYTGLVHWTKMAMLADVENAYRAVSPPNDLRSPLGSDKADFPEND